MRAHLVATFFVLAIIGAALAAAPRTSAGGNATMFVSPASQSRLTGQIFDVYVMVDTPNPIGAYEFSLSYDTAMLQVLSISNDTFLGSTGRPPTCFNLSNQNLVSYGCSTSGPSPEGPSGSGRLTRIAFKAIDAGTSPLTMRYASVANVDGEPLPVDDTNGSVTVLAGPTATATSIPPPTHTPTPAPTSAPVPTSTTAPAPSPTATSAPAATATATSVAAQGASATPSPTPAATNTPQAAARRTATARATVAAGTAVGTPLPTSVGGDPPLPTAATASAGPVTSAPQQGVLGAGRRPGIRLPDTGSGGSR